MHPADQHPIRIVPPGEGTALTLRSASLLIKSSSGTSDGALTCIETNDPPGYTASRHRHETSSEAFYVLAGTYEFSSHEQIATCEIGAFLFVPPGTEHGYRAGPIGGRLLIVYLPPGLDEMFIELEAATIHGALTDEVRSEIGRRHGTIWARAAR